MRFSPRSITVAAVALAAFSSSPRPAVAQELRYDASITDVDDPDLAAALEASSNLVALAGPPIASMAGLIRRPADDAGRLRQKRKSVVWGQRGQVRLELVGCPCL